jgi:PIN domain nuclease of toxin-antitoxin system
VDYVADAHAILWHLFEPRRLGSAATAAFVDADSGATRVFLPSVVVAEMIMVVERGRLPGVTINQLLTVFRAMQSGRNYILFPLLPEVVIASHSLTTVPDIFDRLIVTDARRMKVPLISRDADIRSSGLVSLVWD